LWLGNSGWNKSRWSSVFNVTSIPFSLVFIAEEGVDNHVAGLDVVARGVGVEGVTSRFYLTEVDMKFCGIDLDSNFALKRHLLRASLYRNQLAARFVDWREFTELAQNPSYAF
jgi:hypothetical protein